MATKRKRKRATRKETKKQTVRRFGWTRYVIVMVVALGPGFEAGVDCHAVIETMRGHRLGRTWGFPASGPRGLAGKEIIEPILGRLLGDT